MSSQKIKSKKLSKIATGARQQSPPAKAPQAIERSNTDTNLDEDNNTAKQSYCMSKNGNNQHRSTDNSTSATNMQEDDYQYKQMMAQNNHSSMNFNDDLSSQMQKEKQQTIKYNCRSILDLRRKNESKLSLLKYSSQA